MKVRSFIFSLLIAAFFASEAQAGCTSPTGVTGQFQWVSANSDMEFCNGTNWVSSLVASTASTCSTAGMVQVNAGSTDLQFCDGTYWNSMTSTLSDGSCTGTAAGTFHYSTANNWEEWCDGTTWWVMYAQPTLSLNFMSGSLPTQVQFSRASGASNSPGTYYNSSGIITNAPENLITYSQNFSNAAWSLGGINAFGSGSVLNTPATLAPDGSSTAAFIQEDSSTGQHQMGYGMNLTANTTYTFSVYAKQGTAYYFDLVGYDATDGNMANAVFNLSNGTVSGTGTITSVGNGWYRCSVHYTPTVAYSQGIVKIYSNTDQNSYAGDNTSGLYIWGAQLEAGSSPTSYVYTNGTAAYGPRFDYNPSTLSLNGLLIEEGRTNVALNSPISTSTSWTFSGSGSQAPNTTVTAPDGTIAGSVITGTSTSYPNLNQTVSVTSSTTTPYTFSLFLYGGTAGTSTCVKLYFTNGGLNSDEGCINWSTLSGSAYPTGPTYPITFQALPNNWYRVSTTIVNNAGTSLEMIVYPANGATGSVTVWGAQLEVGSMPTSYIPTSTTSLTRASDIATYSTSAGTWFNATQGTIYSSFIIPYLDAGSGGFQRVVSIDDGTANNRMGFAAYTTNSTTASLNPNVVVGGTGATIGSPGNITLNSVQTMALAYKANSLASSSNGATSVTASSATIPTVTEIELGQAATANNFLDGWLQTVKYYNTRLSNSQVQQLTTTGVP